MTVKLGVVILLCGLLLLGCRKQTQPDARVAIRDAIENHVKTRTHLAATNLTLDLDEIKIKGDTAVAVARFRSKQSPELAVEVSYKLRRTGERWAVVASTPQSGMTPEPGELPASTNRTPGPHLQSSH